MPFSTNLPGTYGGDRLAVMFYAAKLTATGSLLSLMWRYALHGNRLVDEDFDPAMRRHLIAAGLVPTTVFFISIFIALASPSVAEYSWFAIIPLDDLHHARLHRLTKRPADLALASAVGRPDPQYTGTGSPESKAARRAAPPDGRLISLSAGSCGTYRTCGAAASADRKHRWQLQPRREFRSPVSGVPG